MKLFALSAIFVTTFSAAWWAASSQSQEPRIKGPSPLDLVKDGHHEEAMEQARALMRQLVRNGWNRNAVDQDLLRIPDQDYAYHEFQRAPSKNSFSIEIEGSPGHEYVKELAFTCRLYAVTKVERGPGPEGQVSYTEGFYIVGWRDGRVTKVPVEQVRMLPVMLPRFRGGPPVHRTQLAVFPGMKTYSPSLRKLPGVR